MALGRLRPAAPVQTDWAGRASIGLCHRGARHPVIPRVGRMDEPTGSEGRYDANRCPHSDRRWRAAHDWSQIVTSARLRRMKTIAAAKFKAQCLALIDQLDAEGIVITKHGKAVAWLLPIERSSADLIGSLKGRIRVNGDIMSAGVHWDSVAEP
jgi:antitoxin (DNA-binding transcriptional repressor) of toxin-antitoxin stability system